ncbi:MAG: hypothetical protein NTV01_16775 [Bacteroidia bacterium]|nr:hypothetical protein [Bacteroidia bacterium]
MKSKKNNISPPDTVEQVLTELLMSLPKDLNLSISHINRESGIDLYKYKKGGSVPSIRSLVAGFESMGRCPGWAFQLACKVVTGSITYNQAQSVLRNWHKCKNYAEGRFDEVLSRLAEMAGVDEK